MSVDFDIDLRGHYRYVVSFDAQTRQWVAEVDRIPGLQFVAPDRRDALESLQRVVRRLVYAKREQYHTLMTLDGVIKPLEQVADPSLRNRGQN